MNKQAFTNAIKLIAKADQAFDLTRITLDEHERGLLDLARREAEFYGISAPESIKAPIESLPAGPVREPTRKAQRV